MVHTTGNCYHITDFCPYIALIHFQSIKGPGSMKAPFVIALLAGLIVGILAQDHVCMAGAIRDIFLIKDFHLFWGFGSIFVSTLV